MLALSWQGGSVQKMLSILCLSGSFFVVAQALPSAFIPMIAFFAIFSVNVLLNPAYEIKLACLKLL